MALYSRTKRELRRDLMRLVLNDQDYLIRTPTASSTTSLTFGDTSGMLPPDHWRGGQARLTRASGVTVETIPYLSSSTNAGVVSWGTALAGVPDTDRDQEILRAGYTFQQFDMAVERALTELGKNLLPETSDVSLMVDSDRVEYAAPTGWSWLHTIEAGQNTPSVGGDRHLVLSRSQTATDYPVRQATTNDRRAQLIQVQQRIAITTIWLKLRKIGNPASTITVSIQTVSAGAPTGTTHQGGSGTYAESSLPNTDRWIPIQLGSPVMLDDSTTYAIVIQSGAAADASNYVVWVGDSSWPYSYGNALVYNSGGSSWSTVTGAGYGFRLQNELEEFRPLADYAKRVIGGATRGIQINPRWSLPEGTPLRLQGQKPPSQLTTDSTACEIDPDAVLNLARAIILEESAAENREALQSAGYFRQIARERVRAVATLGRGLRIEPLGSA